MEQITAIDYPVTLTKKQVKSALGITPRSYRSKVFTDEVIKHLGFTVSEFDSIRVFDVLQTRRIIDFFGASHFAHLSN